MLQYNIDRNQASKMLNMSTRTIDRYIARKIFSIQKINGKILFSEKELNDFLNQKNTEAINQGSTPSSTYFKNKFDTFDNIDTSENEKNFYVEDGESGESTHVDSGEVVAKQVAKFGETNNYNLQYLQRELEVKMYKNMYETTQEMFKSQQEDLKHAYLKIGQLESDLKNSTYLLENNNLQVQIKTNEIKNQLSSENKQEINRIENEKNILKENLKALAVMKSFYLITTIISILIFSFIIALI